MQHGKALAAVVLGLAMCLAVAVVSGSEAIHVQGTEAPELALSLDTPTRQAQRARLAERAAAVEAATSVKADSGEEEESDSANEAQTETDAALDAALVETGAISHGRTRVRGRGHSKYVPGPAWSRLTGAAKTYHPNDQMCVLCQFLVERTQLDLAHFNTMGNFLSARTGAGGSATQAATGGVAKQTGDGVFLQIAEGDEVDESSADEAEAEEEAVAEAAEADETDDAEAEWAAEDAREAAALEIAAKQELAEKEGDWDAATELDSEASKLRHTSDEDEADSDEEAADAKEAAPAEADTALAEVSAAEALTAAEKAEFDAVMSEFRDEKVMDAVQKQIDSAITPQTVERQAEESEDSAFIEVAAADAAEDEGEADSEEDLELDNESEGTDEMVETEVTPDMVSNGERKDLLEALGDSFDSEINLSRDEKDELTALRMPSGGQPDWSMPTYNADGQSDEDTTEVTAEAQDLEAGSEEDMAMLEMESEDAEDNSDEAYNVQFIELASRPGARKEYAKLLHRAEEPVLTELQHNTFMSDGGRARERSGGAAAGAAIPRYAPPPLGVGVANSPRRFRLADALLSRPNWNRFDPTIKPHPNAQRAQAREMWNRLLQMTYDRLEGYCSTRLPEQFTPFCRPMLKRFRVIAEGLRYGDRPNQICMRTRFCPRGSYVRRSPHNVFKHIQV